MNKILLTLTACAAMSLAACTDTETQNAQDNTQPADSVVVDNDGPHTVEGIAIDGSRRNIFIQLGKDTVDYEFTTDNDLTWEIGDTLDVEVMPAADGSDSIISVSARQHDQVLQ